MRRFVVFPLVLAFAAVAPGMIYVHSDDPDHNVTPPTGERADSGWQWTGAFQAFQGVAIGPHEFLAARHIGGTVGDRFILRGVEYPTTGFVDADGCDLRIWRVAGTLPDWAPLYRGANESGGEVVMFGRGATRGDAVTVASGPYAGVHGWKWQPGDPRLRWGTNRFRLVVERPGWGRLLYCTFDRDGGPEEAGLALGDSSAPMFVRDGDAWRLAAIGAGVDAAFNDRPEGEGFNACLFDSRGLFFGGLPQPGWKGVEGRDPIPTGFYGTRITDHVAWIDEILAPRGATPDLTRGDAMAPIASSPIAASPTVSSPSGMQTAVDGETLVVRAVRPDSAAAIAGLETGGAILRYGTSTRPIEMQQRIASELGTEADVTWRDAAGRRHRARLEW